MAAPPTDDRLEKFRHTSRGYSDTSIRLHEAIARKAGLSGMDHKYLGLIMQHGEMTAGELAQHTGLTTGAVTGLIDRLEAKQLVERRLAKDDRRKIIVVPNTKNTSKLLRPLFAPLWKKTEALLRSYSTKELDLIEGYLEAATGIMDATATTLNAN